MTSQDVVFLFTDLEPGIVSAIRTNQPESLKVSVSVAVEAAGRLGIPVVATGVPLAPRDPPRAITELGRVELIPRQLLNAWAASQVRTRIEATGRRSIAIAGVASEVAVLQTALAALAEGYEVYVLVDACGGLNSRAEEAAWSQLERAGVCLSSVPALVGGFVPEIFSATGKDLMKILSVFWS